MTTHHQTQLAVFDLDGTLIDSKLDLVLSVNATLTHMGRPELSEAQISTYVGNGAPVLIQRALGAETPQPQIDQALEFFLGYYKIHKLDNTKLYPGVQEALDLLHAAKIELAILTNKPVGASRGIIVGLGLANHFVQIYGGNSFETKKPDPQGLVTLITERQATAASTIMIGDSHVDIQTARNAGTRAYGVRYGFQPDTFPQAPPDAIFDDMRDLAEAVLTTR